VDQNRIAVDPVALLNAAEKVDGSVSEIRDCIGKFQSIIDGLNSSWSSDVKDKFFKSYEKDMKALNEMTVQYGEVATGLRQMAEYHSRAEEEILEKIEKAHKALG
jgi:WXG100 family type VII secretion target